MDSDSREELFDSSLNTVNVSVNTELPMDSSFSPKEEEKNFLHFYGEMEDDDFHKMMSVDDLTYSIAFSNEVFDNREWHTYAGLETCNVIKPTRHGKETLGKGVQSNPAKEVSSNSNLTYLSGDDTKLGTDHTKADVYESSNNVSVSSSISENQMQSDSDLEDDLFSLAEDNEICSDSDDGSYFLAEESLEEVLDASFKSSPCTVVSSQKNNSLTDLDPSTAQRSSEVPDPWDRWEDVNLASCCVFDEMPLETCDDEKSFRPIDFVSSSADDIDYATEFLRRYSNLKQLLSADLLDDCNDANSIWSILTDKLLYCQSDTSDSVRYFSYDSLKAKSVKQKFFDAALNNEPCSNDPFLMRSLNLYAGQTVKIKPGQSKMVPLCIDTHVMERNSKLRERKLLDIDLYKIENEKVIINLKSERKDKLVQTMPALMSKGTIFLSAVNNTDVVWKIEKSQMMGSLDCRSLGYFHISRNSLQRIMLDKADFLTDRGTIEYFNILKEDHKNVMKFAQAAALKKQQEIEAKRNTKLRDRKSKGKEDYNDSNMSEENDPYPWLDEKDLRRNMTDGECLREYIDLSDSDITEIEKRNLYKVLYKYKKAFSLRDEIGLCQSMEVELELKDESPFFIRPFPIKESDKDIVDKEMRKGCLLGILKKGMSSYSIPIMLIPRKLSGIPRIVTDFRHLNSRLVTLQPSIPLVRDATQILRASGCEILSLADLRDAYHTLRLSERSKKFCGITPYYGSDSYLYQRLALGLSVSPAIWQNFIQKVLQEIPDHRKIIWLSWMIVLCSLKRKLT